MLEVTKTQKKIIIISLGGLLLFLLVWFLIYSPQNKMVNAIENKLASTEANIAEIISITEGRDLAKTVKDLRMKLNNLRKQLPSRDEMVIEALTIAARDLSIKVMNISFSDRKPSERKVTGLKIEKVPISMRLVCEYRNLGQFLNLLRTDFPILIRVEKIDISGQEGKPGSSEVVLEVMAYLSREE